MAEVILDVKNMPREDAVNQTMKVLGMSRIDAEFYVAISRGEIKGDCIDIDEINGKKLRANNIDS